MEYQEISRKKIPKTNMKIDKKYLPYIVVGVGAGLFVFLTRKVGGGETPQPIIGEGDSVGGNVGGLINDMQVGFNNQLQELDSSYKDNMSNIINQFSLERESMTDYMQELNKRLDETVKGNANQLQQIMDKNNLEIQKLQNELTTTKNQVDVYKLVNQTINYSDDVYNTIMYNRQVAINSGINPDSLVGNKPDTRPFVQMYTKSGGIASVNPDYVEEYIKKGYTVR